MVHLSGPFEGEYGQLCEGGEFDEEVDLGSTRYYKVVAKKNM